MLRIYKVFRHIDIHADDEPKGCGSPPSGARGKRPLGANLFGAVFSSIRRLKITCPPPSTSKKPPNPLSVVLQVWPSRSMLPVSLKNLSLKASFVCTIFANSVANRCDRPSPPCCRCNLGLCRRPRLTCRPTSSATSLLFSPSR